MPLILTILGVLGWQAALIAMLHFGELDWFWFGVVEIISVLVSRRALILGGAASVDWSK